MNAPSLLVDVSATVKVSSKDVARICSCYPAFFGELLAEIHSFDEVGLSAENLSETIASALTCEQANWWLLIAREIEVHSDELEVYNA